MLVAAEAHVTMRQLSSSQSGLLEIRPGPFVMLCCSFSQVGKREEERRDMSRMALRQPWWTLQQYERVRWPALAYSG